MARFDGKVAIVTGGGSGIGRSAAVLFARDGANVVVVDKNGDAAKDAAAEISAKGGAAEAVAADAALEADVAGFVDRAVSRFGGLDFIFANAGISGGYRAMHDITVDLWTENLRVNLIGPFLAIKHGSRVMVPNGKGVIVCTASVAALRAGIGAPQYAAAKAGVVSLVQTTAVSLGGTGVRVNAVCPGMIETQMTKAAFERARARGHENAAASLAPTRRRGQPDDIANMALFLCSDEASFINGQAIAVDGGLTASHPFFGMGRG